MPANVSKEQLEALLDTASKRLGVSKERLNEQMSSGKLDNVLKNLNKENAAKLKEILDNPMLAKQLLDSPQAKLILSKYLGGK